MRPLPYMPTRRTMSVLSRTLRPLVSVFRLTQLRHCHVIFSPLPDVFVPEDNYVAALHRGLDRYRDQTALVDGDSGSSFSYAQLREGTLNVASGLRKAGLSHGNAVTVFTHNRPEFVFALHGTIAGGFVASPINCLYTAAELEHPLKDAQPVAVITDRQRLPVVRQAMGNSTSVRHIYLIGETEMSSRELGCLPFDHLLHDDGKAAGGTYADVNASKDLAFLPYSSGTSGLPKGVMLSHSNVSASVLMTQALLENEIGKEVAAGILPFFHIYALTCVIGNILQTGGTVVTMPKFEPEPFLGHIEQHGINVLHLAPPLVLFLLQHPLVSQFDLSSVKRIMSGGAPLGKDVEMEAIERFPSIDILQGYGLTETSPIAFICPRPQRRPQDGSTVGSNGICAPNQQCKIVDPQTRASLGPGETGELALKGPHVMQGYLNNPKATAECVDEDGWFYTGDIGYFDQHQYFYTTDRVKELIKYKAFQVAPAEVESVLLSHTLIKDCAVVGRQDKRDGEVPIAFIVRQSNDLTEEEIKDFVKEKLAPHKQLHGIIFVDSVPRSASGKLLRRELRDLLNSP